MTLEADIEAKAKKWADEHGVLNVKFTPAGQRGFQDRMFFTPGGRPLLVEFKRVGEEPRKLQVYVADKLREAGYDVRWTDSAETAIGWLKECLKRK